MCQSEPAGSESRGLRISTNDDEIPRAPGMTPSPWEEVLFVG